MILIWALQLQPASHRQEHPRLWKRSSKQGHRLFSAELREAPLLHNRDSQSPIELWQPISATPQRSSTLPPTHCAGVADIAVRAVYKAEDPRLLSPPRPSHFAVHLLEDKQANIAM